MNIKQINNILKFTTPRNLQPPTIYIPSDIKALIQYADWYLYRYLFPTYDMLVLKLFYKNLCL